MNPEIKAKWVQALRSGKYQQGTGLLRKGDSFCCLGVLCDIRDPSKWDAADYEGVRRYSGQVSLLPVEIKQWAGIHHMTADGSSLITHNDGCESCRRKSFPEIADLIEKHL